MVGQTGRRQAITLASGCWTNGIVAHEIGKLYYISLSESFLHHVTKVIISPVCMVLGPDAAIPS